ncbi:MAG: glycosyltransferase family 2 protein, partial [Oscillospiraceae bacterium]
MKTLVIIPCYNEEENIKTVVENLKKSNAEVDYLIVNDCSTDKSAEICNENGFNYVDLSVNLGIGGGVQCGYMYAFENGYDIAVQMDGDGQHSPDYLNAVVAPVANGS